MKIRLILLSALATLIIAGLSPADGKEGRHRNKFEPYSISATALQGQTATDVYINVMSDDEGDFPVPNSIKKLEIKVFNSRGKVVYSQRFSEVPVVDGTAIVTLTTQVWKKHHRRQTDLLPGMRVEIEAKIKTDKRVKKEELETSTVIRLRPDLAVKEVIAPEQVQPDVPFNIEVVVQEKQFQSGTTANVSLVEGAAVLATATGIVVNAGGEVSVLFQGIILSGVGTHDLTATISDAVPAEYDTDNNTAAFAVEVVGGIQVDPASFTLEYEHRKNINISILNIACDEVSSEQEVGDRGSWLYNAAIAFAPVSPIDSIRWEARSASGSLTQGFLSALPAQSIGATIDFYSGDVVDADGSSLSFTIVVNKVTGVTSLSLNKVAGDYYYVQRFFDGTTDSVSQSSSQMDINGFLEVRLLFADGGEYAGGGGSVAVVPYTLEEVSFNDSTVIGGCLFQTKVDVTHELSSNFASGTTSPALLPSGKSKGSLVAAAGDFTPVMTDLAQNYPNPFNPSTTINFTIAQTGPAVLKVYDILGNELAELFHGTAEGGRVYQFTFDASNLASGIYYARLESGGRKFTKRMILIK